MLLMLLVLPALSRTVDFERGRAHLREKTMAPNPGISGSSGARMMRATPETCRSVTLGTSLVPVASSRAISMLEWPDSLKLICTPKRQEWNGCIVVSGEGGPLDRGGNPLMSIQICSRFRPKEREWQARDQSGIEEPAREYFSFTGADSIACYPSTAVGDF